LNIVIVGAGTVGYSLADHLSKLNHHVTVIERNPSLCKMVSSRLDVIAVTGAGSSPRTLEEAKLEQADMIITVTPNDDTNLLACNFAKQCGVPKRIARIKSAEYNASGTKFSLEELGVTHVIEPEKEVVRSIIQYVELPGVTQTANFQSDNLYLRGYRITENMPIANRRLSEIFSIVGPASLLIVLIIREGKNVLPTGAETIYPGDEIIAIMTSESLDVFRKLINQPTTKHNKIVVFGDSLTVIHLARELKPFADRVIVVDPDEQHGLTAASQLDGVEVLNGDCTNTEMLQEVHVENAPFFISASNDTEDNIMSCLLAKAEGAREVIAISNNERHVNLFRSLGLNHIVNPHEITWQSIIANILKVPIGALLRLKNVDIEVVRFTAGKNSRITGKRLAQLDSLFKRSIIIGSVFRDDDVIIPSGDTVIQENDEALVLCQSKDTRLVSSFFKPSMRLGS
jgi:trk system potassium uptake protein